MKPAKIDLSGVKSIYLFTIFSLAYVIVSYLTNTLLLTDEFYVSIWSEQFSPDRVSKMLESTEKLEWIIYLLTPAILALKLLLIAASIQAGLYMSDIELPFKDVFKIVLIAELVPFLTSLIQFIYFLSTGVNSFDQINSFAPLSLMSLFQDGSVPSYITYPLQLINVFELVYWVLLAVSLNLYLGKTFFKTFRLVASSYGLAFLLWLLLVVFIQVQAGV
ncbi:MAG: hypothetical protein WCF67_20940 [Chitinophagaceae bacterium]